MLAILFALTVLGWLQSFDADLLLAVNGMHSELADALMYGASGKFVWIPLYAILLWMVLRGRQKKQMLVLVVMVALTILVADQVCSGLLKPLVGRLRPSNADNPLSHCVHIVNGYRGGRYGFPSSHAANTFALVTYMWLVLRRRWLTAVLALWAVVVSWSRMYLGVHYPGDVLTGAVIGVMSACLVYWLFVRFHVLHVEHGTPHHEQQSQQLQAEKPAPSRDGVGHQDDTPQA